MLLILDALLLTPQVYEFNVPTFGKGVVFDVDHKVRNEQFRFFAEALKSTKLKTYVQLFREEAEVNPMSTPSFHLFTVAAPCCSIPDLL